ncbi:hypothetical protein BS78_K320400 [Paspalum vaginatum]|uniref:Uncharacterized protein n=1 Tax=Paspalum vaginatum TaxID=158149 RepID=A0A9W7XDU7_9POAL|nr:hypothetical protein BS78_K320400 [Paspalum vaginatum]
MAAASMAASLPSHDAACAPASMCPLGSLSRAARAWFAGSRYCDGSASCTSIHGASTFFVNAMQSEVRIVPRRGVVPDSEGDEPTETRTTRTVFYNNVQAYMQVAGTYCKITSPSRLADGFGSEASDSWVAGLH